MKKLFLCLIILLSSTSSFAFRDYSDRVSCKTEGSHGDTVYTVFEDLDTREGDGPAYLLLTDFQFKGNGITATSGIDGKEDFLGRINKRNQYAITLDLKNYWDDEAVLYVLTYEEVPGATQNSIIKKALSLKITDIEGEVKNLTCK